MIQRIQTIFLAGVILSMMLALSLPLINIMDNGVLLNLTAFNVSGDTEVVSNNYYVSIAIVIVAIVAAFSITQYKN